MVRESTSSQVDEPTVELSVIVVTYNEERRIHACLESVFELCSDVIDFEVILVDSNSTDRTREIATEFPISVYRITDDEYTGPGAGRFVGTAAARGDVLLFVDGDMILEDGWLPGALSALEPDDVAAVDGHLNQTGSHDEPKPVDSVWGVALYDASALGEVGGFHPFLCSFEDIYLGYQLSAAGYRLIRLPQLIANHPQSSPIREPLRRWRRGYMKGNGQVLRLSSTSPIVLKLLYLFRFHFALLGWLAVGMVTILTGVLLFVWSALSVFAFLVVSSKLGIISAVSFVINKFVGLFGIALGLCCPPESRDSYPLDCVTRVRSGPLPEWKDAE